MIDSREIPRSLTTKPDQFGPPLMDRSELRTEAKALVDTQAGLDDLEKTIVYYWADELSTELPPGHWAMIAAGPVNKSTLTEYGASGPLPNLRTFRTSFLLRASTSSHAEVLSTAQLAL